MRNAALDQHKIPQSTYYREFFRLVDAGRPTSSLKALQTMTAPNDVAGTAALAICESLMLALNDHKVLPENEIVAILTDAAAGHENAPQGDQDALHAAVAALINGILAGGNSVRRR